MALSSHLRKDLGRTLRDRRGVVLAALLPAVILGIYSALDLDAFSAFGRDPDALILALSTAFPALLSSSTALVEERRLGTFGRLGRSPASFFEIVASKSISGLVIVAVQALVLLALAPFLLGHARSETIALLPPLFLLLLLSGLAAHAFGLLISSIVSTEAQAMQLTALALLVLLTLSGFLQPLGEIGRVGAFAEALPVSLAYASIRSLFLGRGYAEQVAFLLIDVVLLVTLAALLARLRR